MVRRERAEGLQEEVPFYVYVVLSTRGGALGHGGGGGVLRCGAGHG